MSRRDLARRRLPVTLALLAVVLTLAGAVTNGWLDRTSPVDIGFGVAFGLVGVACAATGAVVASRVRGNPVGWIILSLGLGVGVVLSFGAYGEVGTVTERGPLPGDDVAAWVGDVGGIPIFFGLTGFLLLLFPTGRLLGPRWRWLAWGFGLIITLATVSNGLTPGEIAEGAVNPFGVGGAAEQPLRVVTAITDVLGVPAMVVCAAAVVLRLRRSQGIERQQLKWFAFVAAVAGVGLGATVLTRGIVSEVAFGAGLLGVAALPVTAGVAILRHGLYDIDVVIKRTLVYGPLAGALVGTYLVLILGLQAVLPVEGESDLAVAGSTLAVAALFRPLRDRIRAVVDRRFYRSRYDAARTLETFGARLRHQVDLGVLGGDLTSVVRDTMQPAHVSVWLREDPR